MTRASTFEEFADALSAAFPLLTKQQQLIAQFVLEHPDDVALGTAATVARAAGVMPSALVRFANTLEFAGFSELQQLFRARLLARSGSYRERIDAMRRAAPPRDAHGDVLHRFVDDGVWELRHLEHNVRAADLARAIELVCGAARVHVLAQRRAFPVAAYLAYALGQLDLKVQLLDGVGGMLGLALKQLDRGDVLIVASFKDYSPEVVDAARSAHERGIAVVAFTDHAISPLKPSATVCFELGQGPNPAFRSLVAPLCVAQALVVGAGHRLLAPPAAKPQPTAAKDKPAPRRNGRTAGAALRR